MATTLGTVFEWYDFFIYGSLAVFMSSVLFPPDNPTADVLASLGALAAGFVIRPIGAWCSVASVIWSVENIPSSSPS